MLLEHPGRVPLVLGEGAGQGRPLALRLDDADDPPADVQDVVGAAGGERELADGHTLARQRVGVRLVLDEPARPGQHPVDLLPRLHLVERGRALGALHDGVAGGGGDRAGLEALAVVPLLVRLAQAGDLGPQFLDPRGVTRLDLFGVGDDPLRLGAGPALGLQTVADLRQLHPRLGERAPVPLQRLTQLGDLPRVRLRRLGGQGRRDERGHRTRAAQGPVEEIAQLPAQLEGFQGLGGVEEMVVRGVVTAPAQLVKRLTAPADQDLGTGERVETVDLTRPLDPGARPCDELLGQHLPELAGADIGGVRVGQDGELGLGAVDGQERLIAVQPTEVGRRLRLLPKPSVHTVVVHAPPPLSPRTSRVRPAYEAGAANQGNGETRRRISIIHAGCGGGHGRGSMAQARPP